ncbi:porin [Alcanivorax sp.]|uniref:porin n=1 Tax=Alcanivorax sp. TaxID=1872427 RepID=UPI0025887045|nr:porin [Alcanivorax sp.]
MKTARLAPIAAALLMAASTPALAFKVDIGGQAHLSLDSVNNTGTSTSDSTYLASNSSRFYIDGDVDLSEGVKGLFHYEAGVDLTGRGTNDGNGPGVGNGLFTTARDSYIGISGGFGTLLAGRLPVENQWLYDYNLFADQVGDLGNMWGAGSNAPGRADAVHYIFPHFVPGLTLSASYKPEDGTKNGDGIIARGVYKGGPIKIALSYANLSKGLTANGLKDNAIFSATAVYDFGMGDVGVGYQSSDHHTGAANNDGTDSITAGASIKLGPGKLKAQYTNLNVDGGSNNDASMMAIGYDYAWSKNGTAYIAWSQTTNDPAAAYTTNNWGHGQAVTPVAGKDPNAISIGIVYKFRASVY